MIFPRWKKVAIGDECLESSQSFNVYKTQSTKLVRLKKPISKLLPIKTFNYSIDMGITKQLKKAVGKLSCKGRDDAVLQRLDDLQKTMSSLQKTISSIQNTMDSEFGTMAKTVAKKMTVMLKDDEEFFGHGILIECVDPSEFAILTAAHVAVEALINFDRERFDSIHFHNGESYNIDKTVDAECFFAKQYLMHGIRDVGIFIIRFAGETRPTTRTELALSSYNPLDTEYIGRSHDCRIRSDPFSMIRDDRVMLGHPSREGCSGTPMFSSGGEIIAVLHGESKHRRRCPVPRQEANNTNANNRGQGRHTANNTEGIRDEISDRVYVDLLRTSDLQSFDDLVFWGVGLSGCLAHLESLEQYHAANPAVPLQKPTDRYFIDFVGNDEFSNNDEDNDEDNEEDNDDSMPMIPKKVARQFHDAVITFFEDSLLENRTAFRQNHTAFRQDHFTIAGFCEALYECAEQDRVGKVPLSRRLKFVDQSTVRAFKGN